MLASSSWQPSYAEPSPNATQRSGADASNLPYANVTKTRRADREGRQCTDVRWRPPWSAHAFGNLPRAATCSGWDSRQPSVGKAAPHLYTREIMPGHQDQELHPANDPGVLTRRTYVVRTTHRPPPVQISPTRAPAIATAVRGGNRSSMQLQAPVGRTFSG